MTSLSPKEFAALCRATQAAREASWIDAGRGRYQLSYREAAAQCCPQEWAAIIACLLTPGYADIWDWCDAQGVRQAERTS
jgi:hypothetical protein